MAQARPLAERIPRLSRLSWLMGLYAENHRHLVRLFAPEGTADQYFAEFGFVAGGAAAGTGAAAFPAAGIARAALAAAGLPVAMVLAAGFAPAAR